MVVYMVITLEDATRPFICLTIEFSIANLRSAVDDI